MKEKTVEEKLKETIEIEKAYLKTRIDEYTELIKIWKLRLEELDKK